MDSGQAGPPTAEDLGPRFWRSLEEFAETEAFREEVRREFPSIASEWLGPAGRRDFLKFMGASLALAGVGGCAVNKPEEIVPYVEAPEQIIPGKPLFYATAVSLGGYATGVLVETHMGRPTKIEGNPDHPASLGATDAFAQAEILGLYDPDRSQIVTRNGRVSTWENFIGVLLDLRTSKLATKGAGLRLLTETVTSPTLLHQIGLILKEFPEAKWCVHDPVGTDAARAGSKLAFGEEVAPLHHLDKADVVLSLDADFLAWGPARLRDARAFAESREAGAKPGSTRMSRLYVVEAAPTITGAMADHRLPIQAHRIADFARRIAKALKVEGSPAVAEDPALDARAAEIARDLQAHKGNSLVLAGETQPAEVHALAHILNDALGNVGKTVDYLPVPATGAGSLQDLTRDVDAGAVDALVILGGNPVYDAPADHALADRFAKIATRIHLGLHDDETARLSTWHVPQAHCLESWGDVRGFDGAATIQQPLINPLFGGKSPIELLAALLGESTRPALQIIRDFWKDQKLSGDFEKAWKTALHNGVVAGTAFQAKPVKVKPAALADAPAAPKAEPGALEVVFRPDPTVWDGRFANSGWLQELPKPLSRLTWDNAALVSPATAKRLNLANEDVVALEFESRSIKAPVWISPGHADDSVTVHLGYGRTRGGKVATGAGFNAYLIRPSNAPWGGAGLSLRKTGATYKLATTQHHHSMEGRELVRVGTIGEFRETPDFATHAEKEHHPQVLSLFESPESQTAREHGEGNAWGMVINLNTCIGCSACVTACQAENNIPVVGKDQVLANREMHWLRIDRYYEGEPDEPSPNTYFLPVLCMHCEKAPCELVCPVGATTHSAEGLNEMTYNRCVGTRYCSNNCPYKVRRFNFLQYSDAETPSLRLLHNPDVTVRSRGVMEKCTYCVQRLNAARIDSEKAGEARVGGDAVKTACQAACPARAISFGNLNDPEGDVAKQKKDPRNYGLLTELNTRPRTTYLARLTNPNPEHPAE